MEKIFIVARYSNYGFNQYYEPTKKAFISEGDALLAIFNEIKGEESEWIKDGLNFYRNCSYGDYKYITEEISTINWE